MINKKVDIDFNSIISKLKIGDYIPDEIYLRVWVIDELYKEKNKYCKCHLKYIGDYENDEEEGIIDYTDNIDYYNEIRVFTYEDIVEIIKNEDDNTFDLETAFKEVLNIE